MTEHAFPLSAGVAVDPSIEPLMASYDSAAKVHREHTQLLPALLKTGRQLMSILRHADWTATLTTILGFGIGKWGFQLHSISLDLVPE